VKVPVILPLIGFKKAPIQESNYLLQYSSSSPSS